MLSAWSSVHFLLSCLPWKIPFSSRCIFPEAYWFLLLFCKHFQIFHISPVCLHPTWMQCRIEHSFPTSLILPVGRKKSYQPGAICRAELPCYHKTKISPWELIPVPHSNPPHLPPSPSCHTMSHLFCVLLSATHKWTEFLFQFLANRNSIFLL